MKIYNMTIKIGITLQSILKQQNLSLRELSKRSGVPYTTLQEWTGNRSPKNSHQVRKVANLLGVSMHFLFFGGGKTSKNPLPSLNSWKRQLIVSDHVLHFESMF